MPTRVVLAAILLGLLAATPSAQTRNSATTWSWRCLAQPVAPCVVHHGRLSSQNGIALMIWLIGTNRIVDVSDTAVPGSLAKYLDMASDRHSYIYGDFEICPLEKDRPGHMRLACVAGATRLVVQYQRRPDPPFRLLATWPKEDRR